MYYNVQFLQSICKYFLYSKLRPSKLALGINYKQVKLVPMHILHNLTLSFIGRAEFPIFLIGFVILLIYYRGHVMAKLQIDILKHKHINSLLLSHATEYVTGAAGYHTELVPTVCVHIPQSPRGKYKLLTAKNLTLTLLG